jgi:hypothetical protein
VESDGLPPGELSSAEERLHLKLPRALADYYLLAGGLDLNRQHNRLYPPSALAIMDQKLIFMEENQAVVLWGMELHELSLLDPTVFQACNSLPLEWYSEEPPFSDFILKMWRWQYGLDPGL